MLDAALALASCGLYVFPCWPQDKRPATPHGCRDASCDPELIRYWWRQDPAYNVAVATGALSDIFVIDIDGMPAERAFEKLASEPLPASVEVITARGRHIWLCHPGGIVPNSTNKIAPGVDVRGDGGYVLAPPSLHPDGKRYAWSIDSTDTVSEAPSWLLEKVAAPPRTLATPPEQWRELASQPIPEGRRNATLTRFAGHLLRRYVNIDIALLALRGVNQTFCAPPLPDTDVFKIVNSIAGKELRRRGLIHDK
jgi:hypothetical protein